VRTHGPQDTILPGVQMSSVVIPVPADHGVHEPSAGGGVETAEVRCTTNQQVTRLAVPLQLWLVCRDNRSLADRVAKQSGQCMQDAPASISLRRSAYRTRHTRPADPLLPYGCDRAATAAVARSAAG
jgi:hypothetical protein